MQQATQAGAARGGESAGDPAARPRLQALTGIRFVAARSVVAFHYGGPHLERLAAPLGQLAAAGYLGVNLFFVLSGFVLVYTYPPAPAGAERWSTRSFFVARFARIYPMYLASLVVALPFFAAAAAEASWAPVVLWKGAAVLGLLQAWSPATVFTWNYPAWSLSVEACFYLLFPLLIRGLRRWNARRAAATIAGFWLAGVAPSLLYVALDPDGLGAAASPTSHGFWLEVLKFNPLLRLPEFCTGMALGGLFLLRRSGAAPPARRTAAAAIVSTGLLLASALASGRVPYPVLHNALLAPLFGALIYALAFGEGWLARLLAWRPVVELGEASYALYLLHVPLWFWLQALLADGAGPRPESPAFFALYLATTLAASVLFHRLLERPARRILRRGPGVLVGTRRP
jgi:peptidoglycan/LPS O-acetylase OafA/YrhL